MADRQDIDFNRIHDLTVEEIKACPAFAHFTEQEAREVLETLKAFSRIIYDFYKKDMKK